MAYNLRDGSSARGKTMKISLDTKICRGGARCFENVPEVFGKDSRNHAVLKTAEIPDDPQLQSDVSWAVSACPTGALSIVED